MSTPEKIPHFEFTVVQSGGLTDADLDELKASLETDPNILVKKDLGPPVVPICCYPHDPAEDRIAAPAYGAPPVPNGRFILAVHGFTSLPKAHKAFKEILGKDDVSIAFLKDPSNFPHMQYGLRGGDAESMKARLEAEGLTVTLEDDYTYIESHGFAPITRLV